ncbi:YpoC family protein [Jeotgalibacillus proteolyticus]|uniref:YpoC-like domain-containing protein n=1 Tax=Jeotgalibacillus proteolyticus TaxID=2082395 RepID=A0A2S5GE93_9BACL|nr:hypothetical protein [Jeotgalibacillus proteolyticus]PPA71231.1 hypothetical protein C4B60_03980 [Jeotgalibacillus proteolyticus]
MHNTSITLLERYRYSLFFVSPNLELSLNENNEDLFTPFFNPELQAVYHSAKPPWEHIEEWLPVLSNEWSELHKELSIRYNSTKEETFPLMKRGISVFFMMLFWSNQQPVTLLEWEKPIKGFKVVCLNPIERIAFILKQPNAYFSFLQLHEMMDELHKSSAKHIALNKRKYDNR